MMMSLSDLQLFFGIHDECTVIRKSVLKPYCTVQALHHGCIDRYNGS